ncbi:MAG: hypothetical protein R2744_12420 [Bacteroidales bacterium]
MTRPLYEYYATDDPIDINHYIFEKEKQESSMNNSGGRIIWG